MLPPHIPTLPYSTETPACGWPMHPSPTHHRAQTHPSSLVAQPPFFMPICSVLEFLHPIVLVQPLCCSSTAQHHLFSTCPLCRTRCTALSLPSLFLVWLICAMPLPHSHATPSPSCPHNLLHPHVVTSQPVRSQEVVFRPLLLHASPFPPLPTSHPRPPHCLATSSVVVLGCSSSPCLSLTPRVHPAGCCGSTRVPFFFQASTSLIYPPSVFSLAH